MGAWNPGPHEGNLSEGSSPAPPQNGQVPSGAVQQQLQRILSSQAFSRSDRHRRFLNYLVDSVLQGRAHDLTESRAAIEVFNRKTPFDPNEDPIVRVEAGRLRRRLREYYESDGTGDLVVIDLPPRSYVPVFQKRPAVEPVAGPPPENTPRRLPWMRTILPAPILVGLAIFLAAILISKSWRTFEASAAGPAVVVLPFLDLTPGKSQDSLGDLLAQELIDHAAGIAGLRVVSRMSSLQYKGKPADVRQIGRDLNAQLAIEGTIRAAGGTLLIAVDLVGTDYGYHLWSHTYTKTAGDTATLSHEMTKDVVAVLRREAGSAR